MQSAARSAVHRVAERPDISHILVAPGLHFLLSEMRKVIAPVMLLLLAVVDGPTQAQALVSSLFPNVFPLATSEPAMLFLTGLALLSLSSVGRGRPR
jgi:hypothetical protein